MLVIPAIDLLEGHCVQLRGGDPAHRIVDRPDPKAEAAHFQREGARILHLVDLDAGLGRGSNFRLIQEILGESHVPVQVGGGFRDDAAVDRAINAGARWVIVGTRAVKDPDWLQRMADRYPMRMRVAIDAREGQVVTSGWTENTLLTIETVARVMDVRNVGGIIFTNVSVEGRLQGIDPQPIARLRKAVRCPLFVAGGITTIEDLKTLDSLGVAGAIVGAALYTGALHLHDAMEAVP